MRNMTLLFAAQQLGLAALHLQKEDVIYIDTKPSPPKETNMINKPAYHTPKGPGRNQMKRRKWARQTPASKKWK